MTQPEMNAPVAAWPDDPAAAAAQIRQLTEAAVASPGLVRLDTTGRTVLVASEEVVQ